ncbi:MAG: 6,7-dimethyl-8-ribityllumazine synthase [Pirellulales bacterium]|nr:6,7-dimethyl-8-ribityllumazine synthase [Pirellulales bacterium]
MARILDNSEQPADARIAIAVSRFNQSITSKLLQGALDCLQSAGVADDDVLVAWTPGAFELPMVAQRLITQGTFDAILCLGAVIRGETTHDQHINQSISRQFVEISVRTGVPVMFGVLTCDSVAQAINRAGGTKGNKGAECAEAALGMIGLLRKIDQQHQ